VITRKPGVPWNAYGSSLRDITVGRRSLISIGLKLPKGKFSERYFDALYQRGMIRLKTEAEIMAEEPAQQA